MADEVDLANSNSDLLIQKDVAVIQARANKKEVEETGFCLTCSAPLKDRRWCDASCRDDWDKYSKK